MGYLEFRVSVEEMELLDGFLLELTLSNGFRLKRAVRKVVPMEYAWICRGLGDETHRYILTAANVLRYHFPKVLMTCVGYKTVLEEATMLPSGREGVKYFVYVVT